MHARTHHTGTTSATIPLWSATTVVPRETIEMKVSCELLYFDQTPTISASAEQTTSPADPQAPSHFAASPAAIFTKPLLPQPFNLIYQSPDLLISSSKSTTDLLAHCPSYSPTVDGRTKQENHIDIWGEGGCSMYKGLNNSSIYGSVSVVFILSHATDLLSYWSPNLLLHKSASIW